MYLYVTFFCEIGDFAKFPVILQINHISVSLKICLNYPVTLRNNKRCGYFAKIYGYFEKEMSILQKNIHDLLCQFAKQQNHHTTEGLV